MADPPSLQRVQSPFGRLAVEAGYVTQQQLEMILRLHAQLGGSQPLGALFVQRRLLTQAQVQEILKIQAETSMAPTLPPGSSPPVPSGPGPSSGPRRPFGERTPTLPPVSRPSLRVVDLSDVPLQLVGAKPGGIVASMLDAAEKRGASDLHLHAGTAPALRVEGRLIVLNQPALDIRLQERELISILSYNQQRDFQEVGDMDFAYVLPSGLRTRANVFRTHVGVDATFRLIPRHPLKLDQLRLPGAVAKLVAYHQGLVLVTGPTGSGKSMTLAALVNMLNEERPEHILTMEDPIEIVHPQRRALVNQRQVGRDTESFTSGLRGALREDPDIIMIGDLRDRETIGLALTAAQTGHLVIGSMTTSNASRTVGRLIDVFPASQQGQVRAMVSETLRGVISQRLIPGVGGQRVPATELLLVTPAMANLIREGKVFQIRSQMTIGRSIGMRTLDESLKELVASGAVSAEEASKHAEKTNLASAPPPGQAPGVAAPRPNPQGPVTVPRPMAAPQKPGAVAPASKPYGIPRPGSGS